MSRSLGIQLNSETQVACWTLGQLWRMSGVTLPIVTLGTIRPEDNEAA